MTKMLVQCKTILWMTVALLLMKAAPAGFSATEAKADELLTVLGGEHNAEAVQQYLKSYTSSLVKQVIRNHRLSEDQAKDLQKAVDDKFAPLLDELSWEKLKPKYLPLYMKAYTDKEADEIIAFYKSPAGKIFHEKQVEINQGKIEIMKQAMAEFGPKIRDIVLQAAKEIGPRPETPAPAR